MSTDLVYVQMLCNKPFYYRHLQTFSCKEKKVVFLEKELLSKWNSEEGLW